MSPRFSFASISLASTLTLVALLSGCASSSGNGTTTTTTTTGTSGSTGSLAAGGATGVYVLDDSTSTSTVISNNVEVFPAASSGTSSVPTVTIPLSTVSPTGVALDGSGLLYVTGVDDISGVPSVNVYAAGAASGASPIRTFSPNAAFEPISIAVSAAGQAYVLEGEYDTYGDVLATQIEVFAPGASSGAAPTYVLGGTATSLIDPQDMAVDKAGNVYVANYQDNGASQILVFAAGANGSVAPSGTITFNGEITGVAVDASANMYAAVVSSTGSSSVVEYAAGNTGTPIALKTISGTASGLSAADTGSVRVDAAGNIWLIQQSPDTSTTPATYFEAWAPTANGNVAPSIQFALPVLLNANAAFAVH